MKRKPTKKPAPHAVVLKRLRKHFPQVRTVQDATAPLLISVTEADSLSGKKNVPEQCALAKACVRTKVADGAIIGIAYSWLIRGTVATRYKTSEAIAREITSFDRHQDFAAGRNYRLAAISPAQRLGPRARRYGRGPHLTRNRTQKVVHFTARIRRVER